MRGLVLLSLIALAGPAVAADWRSVLKRSKASPPPVELTASIKALGKLGFKPRPEHRDGWFVWTPGSCTCESFMLCWRLERSYRSQLRLRGHEHDLWGWVYDSEASALLAQENYEWLGRVHHYKVVLERRGGTLIVLEGPGDGPGAAKLGEALGHPLPARPPTSWSPGRALPAASQPVRRRVTKETLLDPATADAVLPALMRAYPGEDAERVLNQRGMRFYKTRDYRRAAIAFELAIGDSTFALPIYNRACVAALQGEALRAVVWLWRLLRAPHMYGTDGTYDSPDLLRRARADRDFAAVRSSPEYRAFQRCLDAR